MCRAVRRLSGSAVVDATLEGYVFDSETNAAREHTITDEHGHYSVELPRGASEASASVGTATTDVVTR